jgi:hypothetical protein
MTGSAARSCEKMRSRPRIAKSTIAFGVLRHCAEAAPIYRLRLFRAVEGCMSALHLGRLPRPVRVVLRSANHGRFYLGRAGPAMTGSAERPRSTSPSP